MKQFTACIMAVSMLMLTFPTAFADITDDDDIVAVDLSESVNNSENFSDYKILEGEELFFEDFEGDKLSEDYFPSNEFSIRKDSKGSSALYINAIGKNIATKNFGPDLKNCLVEADVLMDGCNAGSNGGFFISARKTSNTSPAYNLLYTEINNFNWDTRTLNGKTAVRDRLLIARSRGSFNIGSSWFWTSMSDATGALDTSSRSFSEYAHLKMYMSDTFIKLEMYSADGVKLAETAQYTDTVDTISGGGSPMARLASGNIQLGAHGVSVWYDNISVREISVIKSVSLKASADVMLVGETYDIWAESERGELVPFGMLNWEYDKENIEIDNGRITVNKEGSYDIRALYQGVECSFKITAQKEYAFSDYEIVIPETAVFKGEKIELSLKGSYNGKEYTVTKNINAQSGAGHYDTNGITADTPGEHEIRVTYNGITKSVPVYVSEYSGVEVVFENSHVPVENGTSFSVWKNNNGTKERVSAGGYDVECDDGLIVDGERVTAQRTGIRKLYVTLDRVTVEASLEVLQRKSGVVIDENFEDNWYSEFFNVPQESVINDTDGNKVYVLDDEFSPFYGDLSWRNYRISGRVKIINKRKAENRYNNSFSVSYRRRIPEDQEMTGGMYGLPAVVAFDNDCEYLRIGAQQGSEIAADENTWYDFYLETYDDQQIFSFERKKICYTISVKETGGFMFDAENTTVYLDDIKVERLDESVFGEPSGMTVENDGVELEVYANRQLTSLFGVRIEDAEGNYKYVTQNARYEVLSDNAELVSDSLSLRIDPNTSDNVRIGISYGGMYKEAEIVPLHSYGSRIEYLKATQGIRNKNFCYKMLRNASTLGVLNTSNKAYISYVTALLALYPTAREYDRELNWLADLGKEESSKSGITSDADFVINILIVLRNELKGVLNASDSSWEKIDEFIKGEYYGSNRVMISENHRLVNMTDAYLVGEMFPDDMMYGGRTGREAAEYYAQEIINWMNFRYKYGMNEYDSTYIGIDLVALETVCNYTQSEAMRRMCGNFLNWLYADLAMDAIGDRLTGAHGRTYFNTDVLAKMFQLAQRFENEECKWSENVGSYGVQPAVYSFLSYELNDTVYAIADSDKTGMVNKERKKTHHLPDYEDIETLCKYTYFGDGYSLGCTVNYDDPFHDVTLKGDKYYNEKDIWVAGGHQELSMTAVISGDDKCFMTFSQPGPLGPSDARSKHSYYSGFYNYPAFNYMQHKNTVIGLYHIAAAEQLPYIHCYIPKSHFERVEEEDGWIFLLQNGVYTAIRPIKAGNLTAQAYRWGDDVLFTGSNILLSENEILIEDRHAGFVMQMSSQSEFGAGFDEFKQAMKNTKIEYSPAQNGTLKYTAYTGDCIEAVFDTREDRLNGELVDYSDWKLFDSDYMQSDYGSGYTDISAGGKSFATMPARLSGSKESIVELNNKIENLSDHAVSSLYRNKDTMFGRLGIDSIAEDIICMPSEYVAGIMWNKLIKAVNDIISKIQPDTSDIYQKLDKYSDMDFHGEYIKKLLAVLGR